MYGVAATNFVTLKPYEEFQHDSKAELQQTIIPNDRNDQIILEPPISCSHVFYGIVHQPR